MRRLGDIPAGPNIVDRIERQGWRRNLSANYAKGVSAKETRRISSRYNRINRRWFVAKETFLEKISSRQSAAGNSNYDHYLETKGTNRRKHDFTGYSPSKDNRMHAKSNFWGENSVAVPSRSETWQPLAVVSHKSGERRTESNRQRVFVHACVTRDAFRVEYRRVSSKYWFWSIPVCLTAATSYSRAFLSSLRRFQISASHRDASPHCPYMPVYPAENTRTILSM